MRSLVVLFAVIAVAFAAPQLFVQPPNTPAVVLDPLGRPLDTAEVASARALHYQAKALEGHFLKKRSIGHAVTYSVPAAVSHQSRVDVHTSPAVVAAAPVVSVPVVAEPVVESRALYTAPAATVYAGSAVSHQSRVDVRTSPAVVATSPVVSAPAVVAQPALVEARSVYAAPAATVYSGGSAVSHQSRVDVRTSPAVVASAPVVAHPAVVAAPAVVAEPAVVEARAVYAAPAVTYAGGAVSHQSRVVVQSSPAVYSEHVVAPVVEARSVWAPSVYTSVW